MIIALQWKYLSSDFTWGETWHRNNLIWLVQARKDLDQNSMNAVYYFLLFFTIIIITIFFLRPPELRLPGRVNLYKTSFGTVSGQLAISGKFTQKLCVVSWLWNDNHSKVSYDVVVCCKVRRVQVWRNFSDVAFRPFFVSCTRSAEVTFNASFILINAIRNQV